MVVGDFTQTVDTVVIGGGPGGYVAAIRAAQLGQEVVLIDRDGLGGVCLHRGCIPSKAMIEIAGIADKVKKFNKLGVFEGGPAVNVEKLHAWKQDFIGKLAGGIDMLLKKNGAEVIQGEATFTGPGKLTVNAKGGLQHFAFTNCIIATGSRPMEIPAFPFDGELVIDSTAALSLPSIPKTMVVVGAGYIGLEMGILFQKLGSKVTILEALPTFLPSVDPEIADVLKKAVKRHGIDLRMGVKVEKVEHGDLAKVYYNTGDKVETIDVERVLVSVGRKPNTDKLGLDTMGLNPGKGGYLDVNDKMQTSIPGIYAIGDVVAGPLLAHRASHMGKIASEVIGGLPASFDNLVIPAVVFSDPEIATAGLSEAEAKAKGYEVKCGSFPFRALGRAMTLGETEGLTKIVADAKTGVVLGVHIVGPHASDLIAEGALAVEAGLHYEDLALTIHAHPTLAEGLMEAAEGLAGHPIHQFVPKGLK